jgi:hypothetical protein
LSALVVLHDAGGGTSRVGGRIGSGVSGGLRRGVSGGIGSGVSRGVSRRVGGGVRSGVLGGEGGGVRGGADWNCRVDMMGRRRVLESWAKRVKQSDIQTYPHGGQCVKAVCEIPDRACSSHRAIARACFAMAHPTKQRGRSTSKRSQPLGISKHTELW